MDIESLFTDKATLRVTDLCKCVVRIDADGITDTGVPLHTTWPVIPNYIEHLVHLGVPSDATSVDATATVFFDDGQIVTYPLAGTPLHAIRTDATMEMVVDVDTDVQPAQVIDLLTAPIPAVFDDPEPTTRSAGFGWYIPTGGEGYHRGPSHIAVSDSSVYILDAQNRRITVTDETGSLRHINLDIAARYLWDVNQIIADEGAGVVYLSLNERLHAIDIDDGQQRWRARVPDMWPTPLMTHHGVTTLRVNNQCYFIDPLSGPQLDAPTTRGACVLYNMANGQANVHISIDGRPYVALTFTSNAMTPRRVEVHTIDTETSTIYGSMRWWSGMDTRMFAFRATQGNSEVVEVHRFTDRRFDNWLPKVTPRGAIFLQFGEDTMSLQQVVIP